VSVMTPQNYGKPPKTYTPAEVMERYGFGPEHVVDYKAMAGDSSDNIPGVPGVGDKTATLLIKKFGSVEQILERIEEVEPKFRKKIEPNVDKMTQSKWLATIVRDVPVEYDFAPYSITQSDLEGIRQYLGTLEFRSQAKRLDGVLGRYVVGGGSPVAAVVVESIEAKLIEGTADFDVLSKWVDGRPFNIVEAEAEDQPSMFDEKSEEAYVAVGSEVRKTTGEDAQRLFLSDPSSAGGHDVKQMYKGGEPSLVAPRFDSMLAGYVLQSDRSGYDFGDLAQGYLDCPAPEAPEQRAVAVGLLESAMRERLKAEGQEAVLDEIELPLVPVLAEMEQTGIAVDAGYLEEFSEQLQTKIEQVQGLIYEMAGREFNIGSPKQIGEVIFDEMKLPGGKRTKTGWATGAEILEDLADNHEIAREILNYRELTKLRGTYAEALPKMVADDGRIHTSFNQAVAATGRLSSNDPNLQNIPVRTDLGRQIRKAFVSGKKTVLASFDYSQVELRVLAHYCEDEALIRAFADDRDIHAFVAAQINGVPIEEVRSVVESSSLVP